MKYLDEYRDPAAARALADAIRRASTRPWTLMEACGGPAHHLLRLGADRSLPAGLAVVHGPGCPVGAATDAAVDRAQAVAGRPGVTLCAAGDLLRVPGSRTTLDDLRARGADVRPVYSPLDALALARKHPDRQVVSFAVGFEATAPTAAAAVLEADRLGLSNFSVLGSHARLAPALDAVLGVSPRVQAVLAPAHACSVFGAGDYEALSRRRRIPVAITGFDPADLLEGVLRVVLQLERGTYGLENLDPRAARPDGNPQARAAVEAVFEPSAADWRGLGRIEGSGLALRERFRRFDADARFPAEEPAPAVPIPAAEPCRGGDVLTGRIRPPECPSFGTRCTPDRPLGAPMVSAEGVCAAYYRYRARPEAAANPAPGLTVLPAATARSG